LVGEGGGRGAVGTRYRAWWVHLGREKLKRLPLRTRTKTGMNDFKKKNHGKTWDDEHSEVRIDGAKRQKPASCKKVRKEKGEDH